MSIARFLFHCAAPKVFLCHASEDVKPAQQIAVALRQAGCKVFFDEHSLPAGGDYHQRIDASIRKCDLFVFLMTRDSLAQGKYTINELTLAMERWADPGGHVLPVNIGAIPAGDVPPYLGAVTMHTPTGNLAAGVRHEVEKILLPRAQTKFLTVLVGIVAVIAVAVFLAINSLSLWQERQRAPAQADGMPQPSRPPKSPTMARPTDCSAVLPLLIEAQQWMADTLSAQSALKALDLYREARNSIRSTELLRRVDADAIALAERAASDNNHYLAAQRYAAAFQPLVMDCSPGGHE
ncbi:toll/interleukin-1 receptor domain-containing protein [Candidatus Accumulibacter cognatus]|uniref:TIR domain-containing protein n=1 Tax=Candidatus Accumulibacter cognatus TaxID=2954383 RepID=A0A080M705_9PROT|nr:toll/interleukin-1 receptor domain-containing protein [Candidatus Accumulibacter cognatus]KFB76270.1 MAG: hypothetical protein AW06_002692 [Candidatus Accumulibacter cognatus]